MEINEIHCWGEYMYILAGFTYFIIGILFTIFNYKKYGITPAVIFVLMQMIMFSGILQLVDFGLQVDRKLVYIYIAALALFILGVKYSVMIHGKATHKFLLKDQSTLNKTQRKRVILLIIFSVAVCSWFFAQIGGNVFILMLKSLFENGTSNFTEQRLKTYSVIGSGYVYQFRVIILPVLTAYLISCENGKIRRLGYILLPIMFLFILGTGQRGGFVIFIVMWGVALVNLNKYYSLKVKKKIIAIGFIFIIIFAFTTFYNGRSVMSGSIYGAIIQRVVNDNQISAIIAFRYIDILPTQYGKDWLYMFADLLPGKNDYVPVANQVFKIIYGTARGTAPPCIWGSVYYNWGYIGVLVVPLLMGFLYQNLYYRFIKRPMTKFRVFMYSSMFVCLGFWVADAPINLFNSGFVTLAILQVVINMFDNRRISILSEINYLKGSKNDISNYASVQRGKTYRRGY